MKAAGTTYVVIPLCFALASRQKPRWVQTHPRNITVTTGKIYSLKAINFKSATNKRNSPNPNNCLAPPDNSLIFGILVTNS